MDILALFGIGFVAWLFSTLAGGGSPLILIPIINFSLGASAVAPTITVGMLFGNLQRVIWFWRSIDWSLTSWYLPGAIAGAVLGSYTLTQLNLEWLQIIMGIFLLVMVVASIWRQQLQNPTSTQSWQFLPLGFLYAFVSGLIGSSGPVMNGFYLNYGLTKETMIATKSSHVLVVHIAKILTYISLGALTPLHWGYGIVIGLSAIPANWIGQYIFQKMNDQQFRQLVLATMAVSGALMLWQERHVFLGMTLWSVF
jgi:hypothetical protein